MSSAQYIVRRTYRTSAPGLHGWHSVSSRHDDESLARAEFDRPFTGREFQAELFDARQPKWKRVSVRRRRRER